MKKRLRFLTKTIQKAAFQIKNIAPATGIVFKEGRENFFTAADLASEKIITASIRETYPNESVLSEETAASYTDDAILNMDHVWIIDPIDGTNNFKNQRAYSSISVGYAQKGILKLGAVYNFYRDEFFYAESGCGAYLNGVRISVSTTSDITKGTVATETYYTPEIILRNLNLFMKIKPVPYLLVRGCASLAICEVASGRTDLYFHTALKPWDNAGAFLIAAEAGAEIKGIRGESITFLSPSAVIGNPDVVKQVLDFVR